MRNLRYYLLAIGMMPLFIWAQNDAPQQDQAAPTQELSQEAPVSASRVTYTYTVNALDKSLAATFEALKKTEPSIISIQTDLIHKTVTVTLNNPEMKESDFQWLIDNTILLHEKSLLQGTSPQAE